MSANTPISQQAMNIIDDRGEFAMLPFAMASMQADHPDQNWLEFGICIFDDGSIMNHSSGSYKFTWTDPEKHTVTQTRTSAMAARSRPKPFTTRHPLITEPTREDVWSRVMQIIEERAGFAVDEPAISRTISYRVAPDLYRIINESSKEFNSSRYIEKYHETMLVDVATNIINLLPDAQHQSLTEHVRLALDPTTVTA